MNKKLHKMYLNRQREAQKEQGFFDGRFMEKTQESKRKYSRKKKHKNLK